MILTVLSATNRPDSYTRRVAGFVQRFLEKKLTEKDSVKFLDLQDLPPEIFSPQSYKTKPKSFESFIEPILNTDGFFTVMPEYNGGFPGIFKYFIDMLPFPESLQNKPAAFVGVAAGRFGALRPVEQMQQIWVYRNAYLYPQRVFIPFVDKEVEEDGTPKNVKTKELLEAEISGFISFAKKFLI